MKHAPCFKFLTCFEYICGEAVQALKLVYNEYDETKEPGSRNGSHEGLSLDLDTGVSIGS